MLDTDKLVEEQVQALAENTTKHLDEISLDELRDLAGWRPPPTFKYDPFMQVDPDAETKEFPALSGNCTGLIQGSKRGPKIIE